MLSRQFIMTVVATAALALAFAACAAQAQSPLVDQDHHKRGLALGHSGELDLAIAEFDKAIELSPRLADAWCNRGIAYNSKDRTTTLFRSPNAVLPSDTVGSLTCRSPNSTKPSNSARVWPTPGVIAASRITP